MAPQTRGAEQGEKQDGGGKKHQSIITGIVHRKWMLSATGNIGAAAAKLQTLEAKKLKNSGEKVVRGWGASSFLLF